MHSDGGRAGFEPAVPGLGGQCIIQAMLHARLPQSLPLKKSSEKNRFFDLLSSDAMKHHGSYAHIWKERCLHLPTPYGEESGFGAKNERALSRMIARRDAGRRFWTWLSSIRHYFRNQTDISCSGHCILCCIACWMGALFNRG